MNFKSKIVKETEKLRKLDLMRPAEQLGIIAAHEEDVEELLNHKNITVGLYAFDCKPEELITKFVNSQSDACSLFTEDIDRLIEDWERFCNDENVIKSPFFRIK